MPGLLDAVKAAVAREASQLLDKLAFVTSKVGRVMVPVVVVVGVVVVRMCGHVSGSQ